MHYNNLLGKLNESSLGLESDIINTLHYVRYCTEPRSCEINGDEI